MRPRGTKNIPFNGFSSVRRYVIAQYISGKSAQEIIRELEQAGIEHSKAQLMAFTYRKQYFDSLQSPADSSLPSLS